MKWTFLESLRGRYAAATVLLSLILISGSLLAQYNLNKSQDAAAENITTRNQLLQYSRHIRTTVREHHASLIMFLLMPTEQYSVEHLNSTMEQALKYTQRLSKHPWISSNDKMAAVKQLNQTLQDYDAAVHELIKIRRNPEQQYPSMSIARKMQGLNDNIINALNIALLESDNKAKPNLNISYHAWLDIRYYWSQMISLFRIYMANNIGNYDIESIPVQQQTIITFYERIKHTLLKLDSLKKQQKLGFQSEDALHTIQGFSQEWFKYFNDVVVIHNSDHWRADVAEIKEKIEPYNEKIWNILQSLDIAIEDTGSMDITNLSQIAQRQAIVLWVLTLLGLIFLAIGFYFLELYVLRPIAHISLALKREAINDDEDHVIINSPITETQNLVDAFHEMRLQVHHRQEQLEHQALHDALTGLANRTLLYDRLQYSIRTSRRENKQLALLMIDLDRFKEVNDTLGHHTGDALLVEIGRRLVNNLRDADTVARLGGDEFAVLLTNTDENKAHAISDKIHQTITEAFCIDDMELHIKASIGIVTYPAHGKNAHELLQKSDIAMYVAKRNKLGQSIYNPNDDQHSVGRLALMSDLRVALMNGQLNLHYQPKIKFSNGEIMGFEALLRWQHPKYGSIPSAQIISLAEQTGDIGSITQWVTEQVLEQLETWQKKEIKLAISINLSPLNLYDKELISQLTELLEGNSALCGNLTFEITESAMMEQPEHVIEIISRFDKLGIRIAIDDFGTGFSSLTYLKRLPVHELKIDKSFVIDMNNDDSDAVIVRSTIDLAHNLGLEVVAEGIENQDVFDILSILGCDYAQGYHISRPLPIEKFDRLIEEKNLLSL